MFNYMLSAHFSPLRERCSIKAIYGLREYVAEEFVSNLLVVHIERRFNHLLPSLLIVYYQYIKNPLVKEGIKQNAIIEAVILIQLFSRLNVFVGASQTSAGPKYCIGPG